MSENDNEQSTFQITQILIYSILAIRCCTRTAAYLVVCQKVKQRLKVPIRLNVSPIANTNSSYRSSSSKRKRIEYWSAIRAHDATPSIPASLSDDNLHLQHHSQTRFTKQAIDMIEVKPVFGCEFICCLWANFNSKPEVSLSVKTLSVAISPFIKAKTGNVARNGANGALLSTTLHSPDSTKVSAID